MHDAAHIAVDELLDDIERHLTEVYTASEKELLKLSKEYFQQFAKEDLKMAQRVADGKMTEKQYEAWRKRKLMHGRKYNVMREQVAERLLTVNEAATMYINGELPKVYALGYNAINGAVKEFGGYSFNLLNEDMVRHLARGDTTLIPVRAVEAAVDVAWNKKKVNTQILQGIMQGESIEKITNRIMNVSSMNKTNATNAARTFVTSAENKGRKDSYDRLEKDGLVLRKYWIATRGSRTRPWHAEAGAVYSKENAIPTDEPFIVDGERMMFPGDASEASGRNVANCRCTMAATVIDFKKRRS